MNVYRDLVECGHVESLDAQQFEGADAFQAALGIEDRVRDGALWSLKWAIKYCAEDGSSDAISQEELTETILLGKSYDTFVDSLNFAKKGLCALSANRESKEIICYEGNDLTGFDADIVEYQQQVLGPTHFHVSLTEDSDRLTSDWSAGDYRRVVRRLAKYASDQENQIVIDPKYAEALGLGHVAVAQPTLVWLDRPETEPDSHVFDSLTLPSEISDQFMWRIRSLLDTPIVGIAGRFCALSSNLKAISCIDDSMSRLAAWVDYKQYSKVSGLREDRMVDICRTEFERNNQPWKVRSRVKLTDPEQEADVLAQRLSDSVVIELKSTLRPVALHEVYNRNSDVLEGLSQAESLVGRGVAKRGLVITDGYRGDYSCWEKALQCDVTIGTLSDLADVARDPNAAIQLMRKRAGVPTNRRAARRLPNREAEFLGWKLRLVDAATE